MSTASASSARAPGWSVTGRCITWNSKGAEAAVDLRTPHLGIAIGPPGDAGGRDRVLGVDLGSAARLADHWLRGDDAIAVYEPDDPRRLRTTLAWRPAVPGTDGVIVAMHLTVSAQTSLLQSDSALAVVSDVASGGCLWGRHADSAAARTVAWQELPAGRLPPDDATCVLVRRASGTGAGTSLLMAVHPADARRIEIRRDADRCRLACWLFSTLLEKGVMLRGRVLAAVGRSSDDVRWAGELLAAQAVSDPPLSA